MGAVLNPWRTIVFSRLGFKLWARLALSIWLLLIGAWVGVILWESHLYRRAAIEQATDFSLSLHNTTLAGLTAMMITETMERSNVLLDQIRQQDIVRDLRVVPSGLAFDGVRGSKDAGKRKHLTPDATELQVMLSGQALVEVREDARGAYLLSVRPTLNAKNSLGKNCLECHDAHEDAVLGVVSMKVDLSAFDRSLDQQKWRSLTIGLGVSVILLGFILTVIGSAGRSIAQAETRAETDVLTGLLNRRGFMTQMQNFLNRVAASGGPIGAVVMLDLDHFKQVNDQHGHAAGDEVLRGVAGIIHNAARKSDIVGRIGGEEFAIVLPNTDIEEARVIADRLRQHVAECTIPVEQKTLHLTISMGVAALNIGEVGPDAALRRADEALYRAKGNGRNCVVVAS